MSEINDQYIIQKDTLTDIADAVREMRMNEDPLTPVDMPEEIRKIRTGIPINIDIDMTHCLPQKWTRPVDWPDLDSIDIPDDFDGVYMTYDLRKTLGYGWIGVFVNCALNGSYLVERGHLENGEFVADFSETHTRNSYTRIALDEADGLVQLWRVRSDYHITRYALVANSGTQIENYYNRAQPMVERRGVLPYVTDLSSTVGWTTTYGSIGTYWLERDNLDVGEKSVITSLSQMYQECYKLQEVNLNWQTSAWAVRSLASMFQNCAAIESLDFSNWDTSNWVVTNLSSTFAYCYRLKNVDLSGWDTSNWRVTTIANLFQNAYSLQRIDSISEWDVFDWPVVSINQIFDSCINLKSVDLSGWNTTNWVVQDAYNLFAYCWNIEKIDLSGWDTSDWVVVNFYSVFRECRKLTDLRMNFDTSNWAVTNISNTFYMCMSLPELDLSGWNTSNWRVRNATSLFSYCHNAKRIIVPFDTKLWMQSSKVGDNNINNMFSMCYSLESIDLSSWDTSDWLLDIANSIFVSCYSLKEIKGIGGFDTSKWRLTTIGSMFEACESLVDVDLSGWDTSNWPLTTIGSFFSRCYSLSDASVASIQNWDTSNWALTSMSYMFMHCHSLTMIDLSGWDASNWKVTSVYQFADYTRHIKTILFPPNLSLELVTNQNYSSVEALGLENCNYYSGVKVNCFARGANVPKLTRESLLALINKLATVSSTKTLSLQQHNKNKLTPEEIAIATQKGWTVA